MALDGLARLHRPLPLPAPRRVRGRGSAASSRRRARSSSAPRRTRSTRAGSSCATSVEGGGIPRDRVWAIHPRRRRSTAAGPSRRWPICRSPRTWPWCRWPPTAARTRWWARSSRRAGPGHGHAHRRRLRRDRRAGARPRHGCARRSAESHRAEDGGVLLNGGNCLGIISVPGRYSTFFIPPHKLPLHDGTGRGRRQHQPVGRLPRQPDLEPRPGGAAPLCDLVREPDGRDRLGLPGLPRGRRRVAGVRGLSRGVPARRRSPFPGRGLDGSPGRGRTVLLYKAGRTREGSEAAASHTAAAVGDYEVCRELARSAGAVVSASLDQFEDDVMTFSLLQGTEGLRAGAWPCSRTPGSSARRPRTLCSGWSSRELSPETRGATGGAAAARDRRRAQPRGRHTHHAHGAVRRAGRGPGRGPERRRGGRGGRSGDAVPELARRRRGTPGGRDGTRRPRRHASRGRSTGRPSRWSSRWTRGPSTTLWPGRCGREGSRPSAGSTGLPAPSRGTSAWTGEEADPMRRTPR